MTNEMEKGAYDYFDRIDRYGGMVEAIEAGFPQREVMDAAYTYQKALDRKDKIVVGVNAFEKEEETPIPLLTLDESIAQKQLASLDKVKKERSGDAVNRTLEALKRDTEKGENTMPLLVDCVKAYATVGEIAAALQDVFGPYREPAAF